MTNTETIETEATQSIAEWPETVINNTITTILENSMRRQQAGESETTALANSIIEHAEEIAKGNQAGEMFMIECFKQITLAFFESQKRQR